MALLERTTANIDVPASTEAVFFVVLALSLSVNFRCGKDVNGADKKSSSFNTVADTSVTGKSAPSNVREARTRTDRMFGAGYNQKKLNYMGYQSVARQHTCVTAEIGSK